MYEAALRSRYGRLGGFLESLVFIEEPYDGLTVPKNARAQRVVEHVQSEMHFAWNALNFRYDDLFFKRHHEHREHDLMHFTTDEQLGVNENDWLSTENIRFMREEMLPDQYLDD